MMPPFDEDWLPEDEEGSYSEDYDYDIDLNWRENMLDDLFPED